MPPRGGGHSRARHRAEDVGSSSQSNNMDGSSSHSHSADTISSNDIRIPIEVSNRCLTPSSDISRKLKMIFEQIPCPEGYTWRRVPDEHKDSWFGEFKKYFSWDKYSDECIRELWNGHASDRYKGWVHRFKTSGKQPKFISDEDWPSWLAHWSSDEFIEKSEIAKKNRLSEPDGPGTGISKHKGGTRSAEEHAFQLAKERGVSRSEVGLYDVFRRLHHPKGIASSQRALRIEENFQEQVQRLSQPQPGSTVPPKVNKSDVFIDVSKGKNKKRYFGLGNISKAFRHGESSQLSSQSSEDIQKMKEEIKQLREGQEAQKEDIKQLLMEGREDMRAQMEEFCSRSCLLTGHHHHRRHLQRSYDLLYEFLNFG